MKIDKSVSCLLSLRLKEQGEGVVLPELTERVHTARTVIVERQATTNDTAVKQEGITLIFISPPVSTLFSVPFTGQILLETRAQGTCAV